jgi:hypothetical protein
MNITMNAELPSVTLAAAKLAPKENVSYERVKRNQLKDRIDKAHQKFLSNPDLHAEMFFEVVRKFVKTKVTWRHGSTTSALRCSDDVVQDLMISIINQIHQCRGSFYAWTHRICFLGGFNSLSEAKDHNKQFVPLLIESRGDDGADGGEDSGSGDFENPEAYGPAVMATHTETPRLHKRPLKRRRTFPTWIEPHTVDMKIVHHLKKGYSYSKIAELMEMSLPAINSRVSRMRDRAIADNVTSDIREAVVVSAERARHAASITTKRQATAARVTAMTQTVELTNKIILGRMRDS